MTKIGKLNEIIQEAVTPNTKLAIGGGAMFLKPMEAIREIIRQEIKDLIIYTLIGDFDIDLLIGVGAIKELHSCYVGLPMLGMAKNFRNAIEKDNSLIFKEWSELSMVRAFQAGAHGIPVTYVRSILGSDIVNIRPDFIEVTINDKKYVQIPAISPDISLVHAYAADTNGNIYYPKYHVLDEFCTLPAFCSKHLFVTVEKVITPEKGRELIMHGQSIMFSYLDVDYIAHTPRGAFPTGFPPEYAGDMGHLMTYSGMSSSPEGFSLYLEQYVLKEGTS